MKRPIPRMIPREFAPVDSPLMKWCEQFSIRLLGSERGAAHFAAFIKRGGDA